MVFVFFYYVYRTMVVVFTHSAIEIGELCKGTFTNINMPQAEGGLSLSEWNAYEGDQGNSY